MSVFQCSVIEHGRVSECSTSIVFYKAHHTFYQTSRHTSKSNVLQEKTSEVVPQSISYKRPHISHHASQSKTPHVSMQRFTRYLTHLTTRPRAETPHVTEQWLTEYLEMYLVYNYYIDFQIFFSPQFILSIS